MVRLQLAPGESPARGTLGRAAALLDDSRVAAVLVPIEPSGDGALARAARRYMRAWDARFLHEQNWFAPGARVATRDALPGWRAADAAPFMARAIAEGQRVAPLFDGSVRAPLAEDLGAWVRGWREEGRAWGEAARAAPELARMAPAGSWAGWARHNGWQAQRRAGEAAQALRRADALAIMLHVVREAAWTGGVVAGLRL